MYELNVTLAFLVTVGILISLAIWMSPRAMTQLAATLTRRAAYLIDVRAAVQSIKQAHAVIAATQIEAELSPVESDELPVMPLYEGELPETAGVHRFASDL